MLDTRQVAELTKVQYHDIDNMVRFGVLSPVKRGRGKARQFDLLELVCAKVALLMRDDGFKTEQIKDAMSLIKKHWSPGDKTGSVGFDYETEMFVWMKTSLVKETDNNKTEIVKHIPLFWYGVAEIAKDIKSEVDKLDG